MSVPASVLRNKGFDLVVKELLKRETPRYLYGFLHNSADPASLAGKIFPG